MTTKLADAQNFLDINGLNSIRQQSNSEDKASKEQALETAAKQFEAIFMQMLLKSMRKAEEVLESDSPFNSESTKFYRDMHDQQMSLELSNNGSLGLSELIVRQLGGDSENFTPKSHFKANVFHGVEEQTKQNDLQLPIRRQFPDSMKETPVDSTLNKTVDAQQFKQPQDFVTALTEPAKYVKYVRRRLDSVFPILIIADLSCYVK